MSTCSWAASRSLQVWRLRGFWTCIRLKLTLCSKSFGKNEWWKRRSVHRRVWRARKNSKVDWWVRNAKSYDHRKTHVFAFNLDSYALSTRLSLIISQMKAITRAVCNIADRIPKPMKPINPGPGGIGNFDSPPFLALRIANHDPAI